VFRRQELARILRRESPEIAGLVALQIGDADQIALGDAEPLARPRGNVEIVDRFGERGHGGPS